jgi:NADH:ubiquinone oxidoreductase subunit
MAPLEEEYVVYNKTLFNKFFDNGIDYVGEARRLSIINKKHYEYSKTPDGWGPNTWGT